MKTFFKQNIKVMDTEVSIIDLIRHMFTNFFYGFCSGLIISFIGIFTINGKSFLEQYGISFKFLYEMRYVTFQLAAAYIIYNKVESSVFNREKYTSRFAIKYLYPYPKTVGLILGCFLSLIMKYITYGEIN